MTTILSEYSWKKEKPVGFRSHCFHILCFYLVGLIFFIKIIRILFCVIKRVSFEKHGKNQNDKQNTVCRYLSLHKIKENNLQI